MCAIEVTPVVSTERLVLRGPVRSDADALVALAGDFNVAGMTANLPHPYAASDAEAFLDRMARQDFVRDATFSVEHRHFGLVGMLGFRTQANGRPNLGYWLGRPYWNRGYATEAVRGALAWVKRDWRAKVVEAAHFTDNPASGQVLVKAGFLYTGDIERQPCLARGEDVPARRMVWLA
ncbi:GNAT family N-acetyltransferase [Phenylobacterium sp. J367]|uniref:GNAT family N-acetyltransferase n=1 Tax=Phenylobacterium sp. J367 TaxID=2898435 RepID=UPI002150CE47|nr:GNAT family N-acetyltransferase [Phenylobacterium sp. J367]MCR5878410.1 GNAT family N-acetyltransferase [Phenylobacterium sp. J367]